MSILHVLQAVVCVWCGAVTGSGSGSGKLFVHFRGLSFCNAYQWQLWQMGHGAPAVVSVLVCVWSRLSGFVWTLHSGGSGGCSRWGLTFSKDDIGLLSRFVYRKRRKNSIFDRFRRFSSQNRRCAAFFQSRGRSTFGHRLKSDLRKIENKNTVVVCSQTSHELTLSLCPAAHCSGMYSACTVLT